MYEESLPPRLKPERSVLAGAPGDRRATSAGFSITEMIAVMVLVAIGSVFAAQSWLAFMENRRAAAVQTEILSALRSAQERATNTSTGQTVLVRESSTGVIEYNTFETVNPAASTTGWVQIDDDLVSIEPDSTTGESGGLWRVQFDHKGQIDEGVGGLGTISFKSGGAERCIRVSSLLGALRAEKADDNGNCPPSS